jgi:hypothetical protein
MSLRYSVRWARCEGQPARSVEYGHYAQAESYLIGVLPEIDRLAGGWAELTDGERVLVRIAEEPPARDAEAVDPALRDSVLT